MVSLCVRLIEQPSKSTKSNKATGKHKKHRNSQKVTHSSTTVSAKPKNIPKPNMCSYCYKQLEKEKSEPHGSTTEDASKRSVCEACEQKVQNTADKLKNLWSSILPSTVAKRKP